ncbi:unknown [Prevotella sp. CAG:1031]|nr:unknown [Prevotella sp. CAG:1031]
MNRRAVVVEYSKLIIESKRRSRCLHFRSAALLCTLRCSLLLILIQALKISSIGKRLQLLFCKCCLLAVGELNC